MALARNTDPHTSHEAAMVHEINGAATSHRAMVRTLVERYPGHTSRELARRVHWRHRQMLGRHEVARRLADLERMGAVRKGDARHCNAGGRPGVTWYPV